MCADIIHHGHIKVLEEASKLGPVTIGLLTDKAIASYKRIPFLNFEQRKQIVRNLKGVERVIPQETLDYVPNLKKTKPDYVVHGEDWKRGVQKEVRARAVKVMKRWGGKVVDIKLIEGVSSTLVKENERLHEVGGIPQVRIKKLKRLLEVRPFVRVIEAHSGLAGLIVENLQIKDRRGLREFDGMWLSSLTDSTLRGRPDTESVDLTSRLSTLNDILEVTTKPIIFDGDTGGVAENFGFGVRTLERLGVSAVIIEDKMGLKKNSLFGTEAKQVQDSIANFSRKIQLGKRAQITEDFMIIARIESLILRKGMNDAVKRTRAYIDAGADGIMIHSKEKNPKEIFEFCKHYVKFKDRKPLVVVPSTYSQVKESALEKAGVNIVIYANQLLRSAYPAMQKAALSILKSGRALEADKKYCMPIKEIINLIPEGK